MRLDNLLAPLKTIRPVLLAAALLAIGIGLLLSAPPAGVSGQTNNPTALDPGLQTNVPMHDYAPGWSDQGDTMPYSSLDFGGVTINDQISERGLEESFQLPNASGGTAPYTYSVSPALPPGLTFNPANRHVTGMPEASMRWQTYVYRVDDSAGAFHELEFRLVVKPAKPIIVKIYPGGRSFTIVQEDPMDGNIDGWEYSLDDHDYVTGNWISVEFSKDRRDNRPPNHLAATITQGVTHDQPYSISIRARMGSGPSDTVYTSPSDAITATPSTNSPPIIGLPNPTEILVGEETPVGAVILILDGYDQNHDQIGWTPSGVDAGMFSASRRSWMEGEVSLAAPLDYDTDTIHTFAVTANDGDSDSDTVTVNVTVQEHYLRPWAPEPPTVRATPGSGTSLDVQWNEPENEGPPIENYDVQYRQLAAENPDAPSNKNPNVVVGPFTATSTTITGLEAATKYVVQVRARNSEGESAWSNPSAWTTGDHSPPPSGGGGATPGSGTPPSGGGTPPSGGGTPPGDGDAPPGDGDAPPSSGDTTPTANIVLADGANPGEVVVSWDAVPQAAYYRIGSVNMDRDYPIAKASASGEWLEAFRFYDVSAQNFTAVNGRVSYTVRGLCGNTRHAITVLTGSNVVNTQERFEALHRWPQNPRWEFVTTADDGGVCADASATPAPDGSAALGNDATYTGNITLRDGANPGEVVVSWDAVPDATYYRIGSVNMVRDYPIAKASPSGEWLEAFRFADVSAENFTPVNGRVSYTIRDLCGDTRHAVTVLTSSNVVNTKERFEGLHHWPQNPRWEFITTADRGGVCAAISANP